MQLPPVREHQVLQQPEHMKQATHLWWLFMVVELKKNMRQQGDTTSIDILNALRIGELTSQHLKILQEKVSIKKGFRIYPTNYQVTKPNDKVLQYFKRKGINIYIIKAQDQLIDSTRNLGDKNVESVLSDDINKTGGLPHVFKIFVGAKVKLKLNIHVAKGIVYGNMGIITDFFWPYFRRDQEYDSDIPSICIDFDQDVVHLMKPMAIQFPAKYSYATAERRILPLIQSWTSTVHKIQGCTINKAVIYLGPRFFVAGQACLALSHGM